ncbi:MAG: ribosome recycling factor [Patescibacteria group bacterium]
MNSNKILEHYNKVLSSIRTGSVNSAVLDNVFVEAYGAKMKINELATINKPEPSQLVITPFDKTVLQSISKAISLANIGVNPIDNGAGVILNFPPLTEDARKLRVKELKKEEENAKITVRQERQNHLTQAKKQKEAGELSEDGLKKFETELQKEVDNLNKGIEKLTKNKEEELLKM